MLHIGVLSSFCQARDPCLSIVCKISFHGREDRFSRFVGLASKDRGCYADHVKRGVFFEVLKSSSVSLEKLD